MSDATGARWRSCPHVTCAACGHSADVWKVESDMNALGATATFTIDCHGAREVIEWKLPPMVLGPLTVTAFLAGNASPLSHLGEWSRR